ncbi:MAG TPA: sugar isomerase domain-containing protein [Candidatus Limnocylindrales bacterium]|nr:sugar isomerase domain-containing protein [Candidatus Limnocylindrales bacterium]
MTAADAYLERVIDVLRELATGQRASIEAAANAVADAIAAGHRVFVAATSHVLHTELVLRAGGLAAVHALAETPDLSSPMLALSTAAIHGDGVFSPEAGDVVLVGTNAGTDAGTVEVARAARAAGCTVIALTSVAYEDWPDVVRDHPSGRRLIDEADLVVDIGGVVGDGAVELPGVDTPVGPTSGVLLAAAAWAILVRAAERLTAMGLTPIVYRSVQIPGAEALFRERKAAYEASGSGVTPAGAATSGTGVGSTMVTGRPRRSDA